MPRNVLGLDIGGANLKLATADGFALHRPFALWKQPERLADELRALLGEVPSCDRLAVTMTGELCDCFETKQQGVNAILDAVEAATKVEILVWTMAGRFVDVATARQQWLKTAAANWLATATFAGRFASSRAALFVDVGSTTTDLVPLLHGQPRPLGRNDAERLKTRELVYTGIRRTPVCALLDNEVMAELFATTLDAYLVLERIPEDAGDRDTADGRPATHTCAHARLSRMLGGDPKMISESETRRLAQRVAKRQGELLGHAAREVAGRLPEPPRVLITAGAGEFLAGTLLERWPGLLQVSLAHKLGPEVSRSAAAYALAVLAADKVT